MIVTKARLELLRDQTARRVELKIMIKDAQKQQEELEKNVFSLKIKAHNEQADVDNLNSFSLKNLFYGVTGRKEEILTKEQKEAKDAKSQLAYAQFQLEHLNKQLKMHQNELDTLSGCEDAYWTMLHEAVTSCFEDQEWIASALNERIQTITQALSDAISIGTDAIAMVEKTRVTLKNTREQNAVLNGTARAMSMDRYLGSAQGRINRFKEQLQLFREKLDGLPLPDHLITDAENLLELEDNTLIDPMITKDAVDRRLTKAINAVMIAGSRLEVLLPQLESASANLK